MAARKTAIVDAEQGLNLRAEPRKGAEILSRLPSGLKLTLDSTREAPEGWVAIDGIGYVMSEFLK